MFGVRIMIKQLKNTVTMFIEKRTWRQCYIKKCVTLIICISVMGRTLCMEQRLELFVKTGDGFTTAVRKKNIKEMSVFNVFAAHQHKDFPFIAEDKQNKNSLINPLDACCIAGLVGAHVRLLDEAVESSADQKQFDLFYTGLNDNEQVQLCNSAAIVGATKISSLIGGTVLDADTRKMIGSYVPKLLSAVGLKRALLRDASPVPCEITSYRPKQAVWNPDNIILMVTGYGSDGFSIHDGHTGELIKTIADHVENILFSPDGKRMACKKMLQENDYTMQLCDGHTGKLIKDFLRFSGDKAIAFSPDSTKIAIGMKDILFGDAVILCDAENGETMRKIRVNLSMSNVITFRADSKSFVCGGNSLSLVWIGEDGKILENVDGSCGRGGYDDWLTHAIFSPDYSQLATAIKLEEGRSKIMLKNGVTGKLKEQLRRSDRTILLLFSPDGKYLLCGDDKNEQSVLSKGQFKVNILNAKDLTFVYLIAQEKSYDKARMGGVFAPDSSFVAIGNGLYDGNTFKKIKKFGKSSILAVSPDSNCIATETENKLVMWKLLSDETLKILKDIASTSDLLQVYVFNQLCKKYKSAYV